MGHPIALLMPEPHRSRYRFLMKRYLDHGQECILGTDPRGAGAPPRRSRLPRRADRGRAARGRRAPLRRRDPRCLGAQGAGRARAREPGAVSGDRRTDPGHLLHRGAVDRAACSTSARRSARIFGRSLDEAGTDEPSWLPWVHPEDRERVRAALARAERATRARRGVSNPSTRRRASAWCATAGFRCARRTGSPASSATSPRSASLEQELRHAQRLEAVGTLASGIAHDFNNLLMGLAGLAKMALRALPADHAAAGYVRRSLESTERGAALTRQLLMFSGQRRAHAERGRAGRRLSRGARAAGSPGGRAHPPVDDDGRARAWACWPSRARSSRSC